MKKIFAVLVALMAFGATVSAQTYDANRKKALVDASKKFVNVPDGSYQSNFAVTNYPITYKDYYAVTGKRVNGKNSFTAVMPMTQSEQQAFLKAANSIDAKMQFRVASAAELQKALQKKKNIQSENGPYNVTTKGFYLSMSYSSKLRMMQLVKQATTTQSKPKGNGELVGTSDEEGSIFNVR